MALANDRTGVSFDDAAHSTQRQRVTGEVRGEFIVGGIEGEGHAVTLALWWIMDAPTSFYAVPDLFAEILTEDAIYFRRQATIRSLGHLSESPDHRRTIRISDAQIAKLQHILKQRFGLDYSAEEAQDAGRAILRFVGLKLYQQLEKDRAEERGQRR